MSGNGYFLELENINKSFPGVNALENVSLRVTEGHVHGIVGENGAGKSTLMKILSGAIKKDSGTIRIKGEVKDFDKPLDASNSGIGIIYQELELIRQFTAVENFFLGRWKKTKAGLVDWVGMKEAVKEFYERWGISIPLDVPVKELSVAQAQLVEITKSVFNESKIVIMDEPTSSLTNKEVDTLFKLIRSMKENGITILYISHKLEEIFEICDRVSIIKDGRNVADYDIQDTTKDKLIKGMVGRELNNYYPEHHHTPGDVILEVKDLCWNNYVKNVSFKVRSGEILGFAGLVGAGRTETMRALFCAEKPTGGEIFINGKSVKFKRPKDAINNGIAFATEDRRFQGLVLCRSCAENITLANFKSIASKLGLIDLKKETKIAERFKQSLSIKMPSVKALAKNLSGGNQQKLVIAKWLNTDVKVFIFDEPTRGIDVGSKAEIYKLMCTLAENGAAVIMVSSELPEVLGVSDRIIIMNTGQIVGELDVKDADEERIMAYAIGGN